MPPKQTSRFLALLRGINVGGKNIIGKDALRQCFEDLGFTGVRTYIQSGNILFRSDERSAKKLTGTIEAGLTHCFSYDARAVVLPHARYRTAVQAAPKGWGEDDRFKHNACFMLGGTTPRKALAKLQPPKTDIEIVSVGPGVIFWSASKKALTRTTLMKLAATPVYQEMTVRNHNTVFKLLDLLDTI